MLLLGIWVKMCYIIYIEHWEGREMKNDTKKRYKMNTTTINIRRKWKNCQELLEQFNVNEIAYVFAQQYVAYLEDAFGKEFFKGIK